jgi:hypothetical protein
MLRDPSDSDEESSADERIISVIDNDSKKKYRFRLGEEDYRRACDAYRDKKSMPKRWCLSKFLFITGPGKASHKRRHECFLAAKSTC